jgi:ADP-ribosylglycohydrolase
VDVRSDRVTGVLIGAACGDALGVPYEFGTRPLDPEPRMLGGGLGDYAPGEYSDDTQMAVCVAEVAATGADLRESRALDLIAAKFVRWRAEGATDIGVQTRRVLDAVLDRNSVGLGAAMARAAAELHAETGRSAGNGSLMRTAPVAVRYLEEPAAMVEAARAVSELTHLDPLAGDACVIWCEAVRRAVLHGTLDGVRVGVDLVPSERRAQWSGWLDEAEQHAPAHFPNNGFVVTALQAAWSAIVRTSGDDHFRRAASAAVHAGNDTDTIAAIAGALLGARWGMSGIPQEWLKVVHGWDGYRASELARLALRVAG